MDTVCVLTMLGHASNRKWIVSRHQNHTLCEEADIFKVSHVKASASELFLFVGVDGCCVMVIRKGRNTAIVSVK